MSRVIEQALAVVRGEIPPPPIASLIGFRIIDINVGEASMELSTDRRHTNPMGLLHGGVICDLGDAAMGTAFASTCDDTETYTTVDLKCNFLRPVRNAILTASAKVIHRGKTIGLAECAVADERGRLVAKLSSTLMVLRGEAARGREVDAWCSE